MREVGRFDLENKTALGLKKEQNANLLWVKGTIDYVVNRQNDDGGYTFCQGTESNAQDTYYGLAILDLLKTPFPNFEQTVKWLHDFVPNSHYSHYYISKALKLCGEEPDKNLKDFLLSLQGSKGEFGTIDVYVELLQSLKPPL